MDKCKYRQEAHIHSLDSPHLLHLSAGGRSRAHAVD